MATSKTKTEKEEDIDKKENPQEVNEKTLTKGKAISLIIAFISLLIIVYVAFLGMKSRPVEQMNNVEALKKITSIYGSSWYLDENGTSYPLSNRGEKYEKILLTTDLDRENIVLPFFLFFDKSNDKIGRELGKIYFDKNTLTLKAQLPNSEIYDFVYSKAQDGIMENLAFISSDNKRIYYIKSSLIDDK